MIIFKCGFSTTGIYQNWTLLISKKLWYHPHHWLKKVKGYRCESYTAIFLWRVTLNYAYSPFKWFIWNTSRQFPLFLSQSKLNQYIYRFSNTSIFATWWCSPLIIQTLIIWYNRIHSLKYQRSVQYWVAKIKRIEKLTFLAKHQFLFMTILLKLHL